MAACTELKVDALKCADCDALYERPQVRNTNWNIIVMSFTSDVSLWSVLPCVPLLRGPTRAFHNSVHASCHAFAELKADTLKCADCDALYERPQVRTFASFVLRPQARSFAFFAPKSCSIGSRCALCVLCFRIVFDGWLHVLSSRPKYFSAPTATRFMKGHVCALAQRNIIGRAFCCFMWFWVR